MNLPVPAVQALHPAERLQLLLPTLTFRSLQASFLLLYVRWRKEWWCDVKRKNHNLRHDKSICRTALTSSHFRYPSRCLWGSIHYSTYLDLSRHSPHCYIYDVSRKGRGKMDLNRAILVDKVCQDTYTFGYTYQLLFPIFPLLPLQDSIPLLQERRWRN